MLLLNFIVQRPLPKEDDVIVYLLVVVDESFAKSIVVVVAKMKRFNGMKEKSIWFLKKINEVHLYEWLFIYLLIGDVDFNIYTVYKIGNSRKTSSVSRFRRYCMREEFFKNISFFSLSMIRLANLSYHANACI